MTWLTNGQLVSRTHFILAVLDHSCHSCRGIGIISIILLWLERKKIPNQIQYLWHCFWSWHKQILSTLSIKRLYKHNLQCLPSIFLGDASVTFLPFTDTQYKITSLNATFHFWFFTHNLCVYFFYHISNHSIFILVVNTSGFSFNFHNSYSLFKKWLLSLSLPTPHHQLSLSHQLGWISVWQDNT